MCTSWRSGVRWHAGGAVANSRWEASGFMLASHRNPHPQSLRPGRGGGVMPLSCRSRLGVEVPPPLPGRVSGALVRWVREHEPARFPPAICHCPFGAWHDAPRSRRTTLMTHHVRDARVFDRTDMSSNSRHGLLAITNLAPMEDTGEGLCHSDWTPS